MQGPRLLASNPAPNSFDELPFAGARLQVACRPGSRSSTATSKRSECTKPVRWFCPIICDPARRGVTDTHLFSVVPHLSRLLLAVLLVPPGLPLRSVTSSFPSCLWYPYIRPPTDRLDRLSNGSTLSLVGRHTRPFFPWRLSPLFHPLWEEWGVESYLVRYWTDAVHNRYADV